MFLLRFFRYLRGYVCFTVQGEFIERFLNLVARDHISTWDGRKRGDTYTGYVSASAYKKMRAHAKKTGVRLRVTHKVGAPFRRQQYRKRSGLLVGLGVFSAFLLAMSGFIWRIEVNGNQAVTEDSIIGVLEELGIKPGTLRHRIDVRDTERRAMLELQDLSWLALNIDGSVIRVEVSESIKPPEMVDPNLPCNIVADKAGQIIRLQVYDGQPLVQKGEAVLPGDIIVSGVMEDRRGQNRLKHALADIQARVQDTLVVDVPLDQVEYQETGEILTRNYLTLLNYELPVFWPRSIPRPYRVNRADVQFTLFRMELPIGRLREQYVLMKEIPITLTEEQAKQMALVELEAMQAVEFQKGTILERNLRGWVDNNIFHLSADYVVEMPIGIPKEIGKEGTK